MDACDFSPDTKGLIAKYPKMSAVVLGIFLLAGEVSGLDCGHHYLVIMPAG